MICSYPAGGQTDLLARAFGEFIARQVGQTVVIENKAGASGSIGAAEVARSAPDGHTILCSISTTYVMNRAMMKNPGYDMDKDLTLVSVIRAAGCCWSRARNSASRRSRNSSRMRAAAAR